MLPEVCQHRSASVPRPVLSARSCDCLIDLQGYLGAAYPALAHGLSRLIRRKTHLNFLCAIVRPFQKSIRCMAPQYLRASEHIGVHDVIECSASPCRLRSSGGMGGSLSYTETVVPPGIHVRIEAPELLDSSLSLNERLLTNNLPRLCTLHTLTIMHPYISLCYCGVTRDVTPNLYRTARPRC